MPDDRLSPRNLGSQPLWSGSSGGACSKRTRNNSYAENGIEIRQPTTPITNIASRMRNATTNKGILQLLSSWPGLYPKTTPFFTNLLAFPYEFLTATMLKSDVSEQLPDISSRGSDIGRDVCGGCAGLRSGHHLDGHRGYSYSIRS